MLLVKITPTEAKAASLIQWLDLLSYYQLPRPVLVLIRDGNAAALQVKDFRGRGLHLLPAFNNYSLYYVFYYYFKS